MTLKNFALLFGIIVLTFYLMLIGQDMLIPFVLAVVLWFLINALTDLYQRVQIGQRPLSYSLSFTLAMLTFIIVFIYLMGLVKGTIDNMAAAAPVYQDNLNRLIVQVSRFFDVKHIHTMGQLVTNLSNNIDLKYMISSIATQATNLAGKASLIFIYVLFLLLEQRHFHRKIVALAATPEREAIATDLLNKIRADILTYVWVKTLISFLAASTSLLILVAMQVDFASFWVVIIFLSNFIPNIGAIIGALFPALLALIQFDTVYPALILVLSLSAIHFVLGNIVEPKLMGTTLNLSPTVIILSLVLWGKIWGITGMVLCVPITVIITIILAHFPQTRFMAILLSEDGQLKKTMVNSKIE